MVSEATDIEIDDPAGKLHGILVRARVLAGGQSCKTAWAKAAGLSEDATPGEVVRAIWGMWEIAEQVRGAVRERSDMNADLHLKTIEVIQTNVLGQLNLDAPWETTQKRITNEMLVSLEHTSDQLKRTHGTAPIPKETLENIRERIDSLIDLVMNSDLPAKSKIELVRALSTIRCALVEYSIGGVRGLEDALGASAYQLRRQKEELEASSPDLLAKVKEILAVTDQAISTARNISPLLQQLGDLGSMLLA